MSTAAEQRLEEKRQTVLSGLGGTLIIVQMAEKMVKFCMTFVIQKGEPLTLENLERQTAEEAKKTLGYFLSELRKRAALENAFDASLKEFLELRNQFAHGLDTVDGLDFHTIEGLAVAEAYIGRVAGLAVYVQNVFMGLARSWQEQIGMPDDFGENDFFQEIDQRFKPIASKLFTPREGATK
jgi:hypothetical protein